MRKQLKTVSFFAGLLDSYDSEKHLFCIATQDNAALMGFPPERVRPLKALIGNYIQIGPVGGADQVASRLFKPGSIWDAYTALNPTLCVDSICQFAVLMQQQSVPPLPFTVQRTAVSSPMYLLTRCAPLYVTFAIFAYTGRAREKRNHGSFRYRSAKGSTAVNTPAGLR